MLINEAFSALQVEKGVSWQKIRQQYNLLQKQHHPDINSDAESITKIKQINIAYKILDQYYSQKNLKDSKQSPQYNQYDYYYKFIF